MFEKTSQYCKTVSFQLEIEITSNGVPVLIGTTRVTLRYIDVREEPAFDVFINSLTFIEEQDDVQLRTFSRASFGGLENELEGLDVFYFIQSDPLDVFEIPNRSVNELTLPVRLDREVVGTNHVVVVLASRYPGGSSTPQDRSLLTLNIIVRNLNVHVIFFY